MTFGNNLRDIRERKGITQQQLADRMGVDRSTIAQWESGVSMPRMGKAIELVQYFCISLDDLVSGETAQPSLTMEETELLESFRSLDEAGRRAALYAVRGIAAAHHQSGDASNTVAV